MSILWGFVFAFLMAEIVFVTAMLIPVFHPQTWWRFFNSSIVKSIRNAVDAFHIVYVTGAMLIVLGLDAIRESVKYSFATHTHYFTDEQNLVRYYRAQRNMYMTLFALYLIPVARRLMQLVVVPAEEPNVAPAVTQTQ